MDENDHIDAYQGYTSGSFDEDASSVRLFAKCDVETRLKLCEMEIGSEQRLKVDSVDDFSIRKCVDQIQPLPANMQTKYYASGGKGGGGGGREGRYGCGRGRGGRSRY
ncbi:hypothetical protein RND71_033805 [Anisodus tanguticus]|uniref:Uncharacterized protein n=1 Tax=Anisodus tanguticus TaxID=243964 RepID=A0AAE1RA14_9SOLA|nr:hypothetical protein RND71_033805 [Anisodus tanguticus]